MRKFPFLVHSLFIDKTLAQPPRGTLRILGTWRPQANVLGISEQVGALKVQCAGPTSVWALHGATPNYGQIVLGKSRSCALVGR